MSSGEPEVPSRDILGVAKATRQAMMVETTQVMAQLDEGFV